MAINVLSLQAAGSSYTTWPLLIMTSTVLRKKLVESNIFQREEDVSILPVCLERVIRRLTQFDNIMESATLALFSQYFSWIFSTRSEMEGTKLVSDSL